MKIHVTYEIFSKNLLVSTRNYFYQFRRQGQVGRWQQLAGHRENCNVIEWQEGGNRTQAMRN
jgi:hypothetical protein